MPDACEAVLAQRSSKEKEEVGPVGFEPTTPGLKVRSSDQLSYRPDARRWQYSRWPSKGRTRREPAPKAIGKRTAFPDALAASR